MAKERDWEQLEKVYVQRFPSDLQREWQRLSPQERREVLQSLRQFHETFEEQVYHFLLEVISSLRRSARTGHTLK
jgi:predicted Fe-S protein YdhL (DUF1289 family)